MFKLSGNYLLERPGWCLDACLCGVEWDQSWSEVPLICWPFYASKITTGVLLALSIQSNFSSQVRIKMTKQGLQVHGPHINVYGGGGTVKWVQVITLILDQNHCKMAISGKWQNILDLSLLWGLSSILSQKWHCSTHSPSFNLFQYFLLPHFTVSLIKRYSPAKGGSTTSHLS